jgi:hypothetical protein
MSDADLLVKGRINALWVSEQHTGGKEYSEAEVKLDLAIFSQKADKQPLWFDVKRGRARSKDTLVDVTSENERILNEALQRAITAFVNDEKFHVVISGHR